MSVFVDSKPTPSFIDPFPELAYNHDNEMEDNSSQTKCTTWCLQIEQNQGRLQQQQQQQQQSLRERNSSETSTSTSTNPFLDSNTNSSSSSFNSMMSVSPSGVSPGSSPSHPNVLFHLNMYPHNTPSTNINTSDGNCNDDNNVINIHNSSNSNAAGENDNFIIDDDNNVYNYRHGDDNSDDTFLKITDVYNNNNNNNNDNNNNNNNNNNILQVPRLGSPYRPKQTTYSPSHTPHHHASNIDQNKTRKISHPWSDGESDSFLNQPANNETSPQVPSPRPQSFSTEPRQIAEHIPVPNHAQSNQMTSNHNFPPIIIRHPSSGFELDSSNSNVDAHVYYLPSSSTDTDTCSVRTEYSTIPRQTPILSQSTFKQSDQNWPFHHTQDYEESQQQKSQPSSPLSLPPPPPPPPPPHSPTSSSLLTSPPPPLMLYGELPQTHQLQSPTNGYYIKPQSPSPEAVIFHNQGIILSESEIYTFPPETSTVNYTKNEDGYLRPANDPQVARTGMRTQLSQSEMPDNNQNSKTSSSGNETSGACRMVLVAIVIIVSTSSLAISSYVLYCLQSDLHTEKTQVPCHVLSQLTQYQQHNHSPIKVNNVTRFTGTTDTSSPVTMCNVPNKALGVTDGGYQKLAQHSGNSGNAKVKDKTLDQTTNEDDHQSLRVQRSGTYFIYFGVHLKYTGLNKCEWLDYQTASSYLVKTDSDGYDRALVRNEHTCCHSCPTESNTEYTGGIFHLNQDSRLHVEVSDPTLVQEGKNTFLGYFLVKEDT